MQYQLLSEQQDEIIKAYAQMLEVIKSCLLAQSTCDTKDKMLEYSYLMHQSVQLAEMNIEQVHNEMEETGTYVKQTFSDTKLS